MNGAIPDTRDDVPVTTADRAERPIVILNPVAGRADPESLEEMIRRVASARGIDPDMRRTTGAGDAHRWAKEAAETGCPRLIAVGGDGTLREVVSGVVAASGSAEVAFVPRGTANVMARTLDLPSDPEEALEVAFENDATPFDVGYEPETGDCFLISAAAGFPARIMKESSVPLKRRVGVLAYGMAAMRHIGRLFRGRRMLIEIDGRRIATRASSVLVVNTGTLGGSDIELVPGASAHDGLLDVLVVETRTPWMVMRQLVQHLRGSRRREPRIRRAKEVTVRALRPLAFQLDGDTIERREMHVCVHPQAIGLVVGKDLQAE